MKQFRTILDEGNVKLSACEVSQYQSFFSFQIYYILGWYSDAQIQSTV